MPDLADGWYDRTKPWDSNAERLVSEKLVAAASALPPDGWVNKQPLFPDRYGFEQRALTVQDCFAIETTYGNARDGFSRVTSGYSGSSTPSLPLV